MLFAFASAKVQLILYLTNIILIFLRRDRKKFHIHTKKGSAYFTEPPINSSKSLNRLQHLPSQANGRRHKQISRRLLHHFSIPFISVSFKQRAFSWLISVYVSHFVKYVYPLSCTRHDLLSLTFLVLFNLAKQRINAEVNTFFKRVAHLFCVQVCSWE